LDVHNHGFITKDKLALALSRFTNAPADRIDLTLAETMVEIGSNDNSTVSKNSWFKLLEAWSIHNSERRSNIIVVVPSTPAQYFHCLRRQIHRSFSKPLICFSGKWLLHHKACTSTMDDIGVGTFFQRVIVEGGRGDNMKGKIKVNSDDSKIKKVIFCSGKVFYHLFHTREAVGVNEILIIRIEQVAPFPYDLIGPLLLRFKNAEFVWCQEEPKNMGGWTFVKPRILTAMKENGIEAKSINYVGRKPSSSSASGGNKIHMKEQKDFIAYALKI
jgi:2-oxoglutarate dehydrogenase E1 component